MSNALAVVDDGLDEAILKAAGLDKVPPAQRTLAINIAQRYGLDLMLKHLIIVEGRPYITRDGLIHVALRSGVFDGIEVTDPVLGDTHWHCRATVYRKDMSRGIAYPGRYPKAGSNARFAPEMAIKVAEVMALRRAFDVSAPVIEERWDMEDAAPPEARQPVPLAAKAAAARERIESRTVTPIDEPPPSTVASGEVERESGPVPSPVMDDEPPLPPEPPARRPAKDDASSFGLKQCPEVGGDKRDQCIRAPGHSGTHDNGVDRW